MRVTNKKIRLRSIGFFIFMVICVGIFGTFFTYAEPINHPPETKDYAYTIFKNKSVSDSVYGKDADGDELSYVLNLNPIHGKVIVNKDGSWTYTPEQNFIGADSFDVKVTDVYAAYALSLVKITVNDNNNPVVSDYNLRVYRNKSVSYAVYGNDPDGDLLIYTKFSDASHGVAEVQPNGSWVYTPTSNYTGTDNFQVAVSDGKGGSAISTIKIEVRKKKHHRSTSTDSNNESNSSNSNSNNSSNQSLNDSKTMILPDPPTVEQLSQYTDVPNAAAFEEQSGNSEVPVLTKKSVEENKKKDNKEKTSKKVDTAKTVKKENSTNIPGGLPKLPKTGGIPPFLFYGLGGMAVTAGILLRRLKK